ncbi:long-chain-fatty-acid--CoA ligase [Ranunculus cassubicifolius]
MKVFAAQVESGKQGKNGEPSIGPVYRKLLSKDQFPPPDEDIRHRHNLGYVQFGPYVWKTYMEVYTEVLHIGSALRASGSGASPACGGHIIICVRLYDTLGKFSTFFTDSKSGSSSQTLR